MRPDEGLTRRLKPAPSPEERAGLTRFLRNHPLRGRGLASPEGRVRQIRVDIFMNLE